MVPACTSAHERITSKSSQGLNSMEGYQKVVPHPAASPGAAQAPYSVIQDVHAIPFRLAGEIVRQRIRGLLLQLEWTESDAWILVWELPDSFQATILDQNTPPRARCRSVNLPCLFRHLRSFFQKKKSRVADPLVTARSAPPVPPAELPGLSGRNICAHDKSG